MKNQEYSTTTITLISLDSTDIITSSTGTEAPIVEIKGNQWEW